MSGGAERVYRLLLRLLPRRLRERHGDELVALFRESLERARRRRGTVGWLGAWLAGTWDVLRRAGYESGRRLRLGQGVVADLRFAFRGFLRQPGTTLLVVLMLALAIGAGTAVFSVATSLFLRPLPFPDPHRLVYLNETAPRWELEETGISYLDFLRWREHTRGFEALGLYSEDSYNLSDGARAERVDGAEVTYDFAAALGVEPVAGRGFTREEDGPGGAPVVMIGDALWRDRFRRSPNAVGQSIRIDGEEHTIVGVLPPEAEFPGRVKLWVPMAHDPLRYYAGWSFDGIGRLRPGVTMDAARADLLRAHEAVWAELDTARIVSPVMVPLRERLVGDLERVAVALGGGVALVLVIACANVAGLLLARALARRREIGIRMAMGASVGRLSRQLLTESLALSLVAAPLGVLLGIFTVQLLLRGLPQELPAWMVLRPDWTVGLFGLAMVAATTVLFGWAPVVQARRERVRDALVEGGRAGSGIGQRRTMSLLVVAEVTLAALLLISGGLLLRAFDRLRAVEPGFRTEDVLGFRLELTPSAYPDAVPQLAFYAELISRLEALPGVRAAGGVTCPPLDCHLGGFFEMEGRAIPEGETTPIVLRRSATPGYFRAMGIGLVGGRFLQERDGQPGAAPAVVVNESFVREIMGGVDDPVGRRVRFRGDTPWNSWYTVVGVARDVKHYGLDEPMRPGLYFALGAMPDDDLALFLWTSTPPTTLLPAVRDVVRRLDPEVPLFQVATTAETVERSLAVRRAYSRIMGVFAGMALVLALGGIYGVLSYVVGQRMREIGIRVALGASRARVAAMVVRQGMTLVLLGLAIGFAAALAAGRVLGSLLFGVSARDPLTFAGVAALLALTALLATLAPARRALSVDPQVVLREE